MLDNTDLNCEIIDTILIDQESKAEYKLDNYVMGTPLEDQDEDHVEELLESVWGCFDDYETLEGEDHYIVLAKDLEESN